MNGFYSSPSFGTGQIPSNVGNPFDPQGAGGHYLRDDSNFRDAGTTSMDPGLLDALSRRTTTPPEVQQGLLSTPLFLGRRSIEDENALPALGGLPDLGYHYEALDYIFHDAEVRGTVELSGGVAVGVQGSTVGWGLKLLDGGSLECLGGPLAMNRIVSFQNAQESPAPIPTTGYFARPGNVWLPHISGTDANCRMVFRFTDLAVGQGCGATVVSVANGARLAELTFQHCRVRGGLVSVICQQVTAARQVKWVNNVWERATPRLIYYKTANSPPYYPVTLECRNNLFRDSNLSLIYQAVDEAVTGVWEVKDNLLDLSANVATTDARGAVLMQRSHNAATAGMVNNLGGSWFRTDLVRDYQSGPLGEYYYPDNSDPYSLARLVNAGSRTALQAGMACGATQVATLDTGQVDIGFHYHASAAPVWADPQSRVTDLNREIDITLTGSGGCADPLQYTVLTQPTKGTLSGNPAPPQLRYDPHTAWLGDLFTFRASDGLSDDETTVYISVLPPAVLNASGACDSIGLEWSLPANFSPFDFVKDFVIYRAVFPDSAYPNGTIVATFPKVPGPLRYEWQDTTVVTGEDYNYAVVYHYDDPPPDGDGEHAVVSNEVRASTRTIENPGPTDVAFIIDNTGSMGTDLLAKLQEKIGYILNCLVAYSGTDYQLALITPDNDQVHVHVAFSLNNRAVFEQAFAELQGTSSGESDSESTDECLYTVLGALSENGRVNPCACSPATLPLQIGSATRFRDNVRKLVVLITDAPPDGFCDSGGWHHDHAEAYANQARDATNGCVRINAVEVDPRHPDPQYVAELNYVMEEVYAMTTCGWHSRVPHDGGDIVGAVLKMIYENGYCECP